MLGLITLAGLGCMCMGNPPRRKRRHRVGGHEVGQGTFRCAGCGRRTSVRVEKQIPLFRSSGREVTKGFFCPSCASARRRGETGMHLIKRLEKFYAGHARSNPGLEAYHFYFSTHPSLIHGKRIVWTRYGMSPEQVKRLGIAAAKSDYPKACDFAVAKIKKNPRKKRRK